MNDSANSSPEAILQQKRKRRQAEYIGLMAFQASFAYMFHHFLEWVPAIIVGIMAISMGWVLATLREKRRTLSTENRTRILSDAMESLLIMFLITLTGIISIKIGVELLIIQAHLCIFLSAYFAGSLFGETSWITKNFGMLTPVERRNYLHNLNKSIIFPYNSEFIRSLFRK